MLLQWSQLFLKPNIRSYGQKNHMYNTKPAGRQQPFCRHKWHHVAGDNCKLLQSEKQSITISCDQVLNPETAICHHQPQQRDQQPAISCRRSSGWACAQVCLSSAGLQLLLTDMGNDWLLLVLLPRVHLSSQPRRLTESTTGGGAQVERVSFKPCRNPSDQSWFPSIAEEADLREVLGYPRLDQGGVHTSPPPSIHFISDTWHFRLFTLVHSSLFLYLSPSLSLSLSLFHLSPSALLHLHFPHSFLFPFLYPPSRLPLKLGSDPHHDFFPPFHFSFGGLWMNAIQSRARLRDMNFH